MIAVLCVEGRTGSAKKREVFKQDMERSFALDTLKHELETGFTPIGVKKNKVLIERLNAKFSRTEYRTYQGPIPEMKRLVSLAKTHKPA